MVEQARRTNDYKSEWVVEKVKNAVLEFEKENGRKPQVACMGLAFKPDIDDLRESPALYITQALNETNDVVAVEPNIQSFDGLKLVSEEQADNADILVYLVAHSQFKAHSKSSKTLDFAGLFK